MRQHNGFKQTGSSRRKQNHRGLIINIATFWNKRQRINVNRLNKFVDIFNNNHFDIIFDVYKFVIICFHTNDKFRLC